MVAFAMFVTVAACTAISGLDADYRLAPVPSVVDASGDVGVDSPALLDGGKDGADTDDAAQRCSAPPCALPCGNGPCRSCREVKDAYPATETGLAMIEGKGGPFDAHCEMALAEGGWTLIGRSVRDGVAPAFGWYAAHGSAAADDLPYSLGVDRLSFVPTELLFGALTGEKAWGANVYRVILPTNFIAANKATASPLSLVPVKGQCGGGAMHSYAGYTSRTDVFFFRDSNDDNLLFGLFPDGFFANGNASCSYASGLDGFQGMIFVR